MSASLPPGPGIASSSTTASRVAQEAISAKGEFRELCRELGLSLDDGTVCKRGAARYLEQKGYFPIDEKSVERESTIRGWVNPLALHRKPPERVLEFLRRRVQAERLRAQAAVLEAIR